MKYDQLVRSQVIEDHFWVNEKNYEIQTDFCFDPITVYEGQTFDFSADFSTDSNTRDEATWFGIYLKVNGEHLAQGLFQEYQENDKYANTSVSMIYRETVAENSKFEFCYWAAPTIATTLYTERSFQFGYRIYDTGYRSQLHWF